MAIEAAGAGEGAIQAVGDVGRSHYDDAIIHLRMRFAQVGGSHPGAE